MGGDGGTRPACPAPLSSMAQLLDSSQASGPLGSLHSGSPPGTLGQSGLGQQNNGGDTVGVGPVLGDGTEVRREGAAAEGGSGREKAQRPLGSGTEGHAGQWRVSEVRFSSSSSSRTFCYSFRKAPRKVPPRPPLLRRFSLL